MSEGGYNSNTQQVLERLSRAPSQRTDDTTMVTSPGAGTIAWSVKIKSNSSYNLYNVITVVISDVGTEPAEIGQQTQAFNLAESFSQQGALEAGTYVVMFRVGGKNVFYAPV
jgi:hypothetical protein